MVALDGAGLKYENATVGGEIRLVLPADNRIGVWDLCYFVLFNRFLLPFDIPTLLVLFIDGFSLKKRIAFCLIMHTLFRNIGGIMYGVVKYIFQEDAYNIWRYTTGYPTAPWYIGELFLDSYPFQKAWAVAGGKLWLKIIACIGFAPLLLYKLFIIVYRYYATQNTATEKLYFAQFNPLDAGAVAAQAWNDIWSCFVIVYVGLQSRKLTKSGGGDDFLANLVRTTELRIILCTILTIIPAVLLSSERCIADSVANACIYNGARNIAVDIVYGLYFLDYLIIKYYKVVKGEKSTPVPVPSHSNENNHNNNNTAVLNRNQNWITHGPKYSNDLDVDITPRSKNDELSFAAMMKASDMRQRPTPFANNAPFNNAVSSPLGSNTNLKKTTTVSNNNNNNPVSPPPNYTTPQISGATLSSNYVPQMQYVSVGSTAGSQGGHSRAQSQSNNNNQQQSQVNYANLNMASNTGSAIDYGSSYDDRSSIWYQSSSYSASNR